MKTAIFCPTVDELQMLSDAALEQMARIVEVAIAKPYVYERIRLAQFLKEGV